jgi:hypothetical protein
MGRRVRGIPAFIRCEWTEAKERKIRVSCTDREREREREGVVAPNHKRHRPRSLAWLPRRRCVQEGGLVVKGSAGGGCVMVRPRSAGSGRSVHTVQYDEGCTVF